MRLVLRKAEKTRLLKLKLDTKNNSMVRKRSGILINFGRYNPFFCSFVDIFSVISDYPLEELLLLHLFILLILFIYIVITTNYICFCKRKVSLSTFLKCSKAVGISKKIFGVHQLTIASCQM